MFKVHVLVPNGNSPFKLPVVGNGSTMYPGAPGDPPAEIDSVELKTVASYYEEVNKRTKQKYQLSIEEVV
jgi:hypothetical protein